MVFIVRMLEVIQYFVQGVRYHYTRNVVASKISSQLILHIIVKDVLAFADQLMGDLKSM